MERSMNEKGFAVKRGLYGIATVRGCWSRRTSPSRIEHSLVLAASIPWPCPFNLLWCRWSRCGARDLVGLSMLPLSMDFAVLLRDVAMGDDET